MYCINMTISYRPGAGDTKTEVLEQYRRVDRFLAGLETKAVVDAKYRAMEVVGLLLNMQNNVMLEVGASTLIKVKCVSGNIL